MTQCVHIYPVAVSSLFFFYFILSELTASFEVNNLAILHLWKLARVGKYRLFLKNVFFLAGLGACCHVFK